MATVTKNRLQTKYTSEVAKQLADQFKIGNPHAVPTITKVVVNVGAGRLASETKKLDELARVLAKVTGQAPVRTAAKKSIAGFKLRQGQNVGLMVTLRGQRMYDFLDRLVSITLPRIRDFRGVSAKAFDPQGNYSLGIKDLSIFPELSYEEAGGSQSLQINIVTTARTQEQGAALLRGLGFPLRKEGK